MIPSLYNTGLLAIAALISTSGAHLTMKTPVPFGVSTLNNSPLNNAAPGTSGSDFPCKQRQGVYEITKMNEMNVGDNQTLSFEGSASHGGGTCQVAVSLDLEPTATSTWKIIQVYEGGCPITAAGNAGTDTFSYKIPEKFPNGKATLAWVWFNRIGQREFYMNCAPITVSGGADDKDYYNTLPNMYVINLPTSSCSSVEGTNQEIPVPGQFVVKGDPTDKVAAASGAGCAAAAAAQTSGVSNLATGTVDNGAGMASGSAAASNTAAPVGNNPGAGSGQGSQPSGMTTLASSAPVSLAMSAAPVASSAPASVAAPPSTTQATDGSVPPVASVVSPAVGGSTNGTASTGGTSCPTDGIVVCNGPSQFGLCDHGQVVFQAVAAGTTCQNGAISKRSDTDPLVRNLKAHLRRHQRDYSS